MKKIFLKWILFFVIVGICFLFFTNKYSINFELLFVIIISIVVLFLIIFGYINAKKSIEGDYNS
jgi:hypothetical protein